MNQPTQSRDEDSTKADLRTFLCRHGYPEILCLQEVKIAPRDARTQHAVQVAISPQASVATSHDFEPTYTAHFNLPTDPYNATGFGRRVHGVATIIRDDILATHVGRVRNVDWDAEGRIQVIEMHFPSHLHNTISTKLALFNVYLVNGTSYPYKSPQTGKVIGTRHDRKREVHRLLQRECQAMIAQGWEIVIAGDVNVARSTIDGWPRLREWPEEHVVNRANFEMRFFANGKRDGKGASGSKDAKSLLEEHSADGALELVDSFRWMHSERRGYTYYPRGRNWGSSCDRVDLIMLSQALVHGEHSTLKQAEIFESPQERGPSDHVPLSVELELIAASELNEASSYLSFPWRIYDICEDDQVKI